MAEKKIDPLAIVVGSLVFIAAYPVWKLAGGWRERRQRENEQRETEERENKEKRQREIRILEAIKAIRECWPESRHEPGHIIFVVTDVEHGRLWPRKSRDRRLNHIATKPACVST